MLEAASKQRHNVSQAPTPLYHRHHHHHHHYYHYHLSPTLLTILSTINRQPPTTSHHSSITNRKSPLSYRQLAAKRQLQNHPTTTRINRT
jgi:hypothetical protein